MHLSWVRLSELGICASMPRYRLLCLSSKFSKRCAVDGGKDHEGAFQVIFAITRFLERCCCERAWELATKLTRHPHPRSGNYWILNSAICTVLWSSIYTRNPSLISSISWPSIFLEYHWHCIRWPKCVWSGHSCSRWSSSPRTLSQTILPNLQKSSTIIR